MIWKVNRLWIVGFLWASSNFFLTAQSTTPSFPGNTNPGNTGTQNKGNPNSGNPGFNPPSSSQEIDPQLDRILLDWEKKMNGIDKLSVECIRKQKEAINQTVEMHQGYARLLKPKYVLLDLQEVPEKSNKKSDPSNRELYTSDGKTLNEYSLREKKVIIHQLAQNREIGEENALLGFIFGMKAVNLKKWYGLKLEKMDANYIYVRLYPRRPSDMQEFKEAQIVFFAPGIVNNITDAKLKQKIADSIYLPARLLLWKPNGNENTWLFKNYDLHSNLAPNSFNIPIPKDWKTQIIAEGKQDEPSNQPKIPKNLSPVIPTPPTSKTSNKK